MLTSRNDSAEEVGIRLPWTPVQSTGRINFAGKKMLHWGRLKQTIARRIISYGESTAGECSQVMTLLGKIFAGDVLQIGTKGAPGSTWTRYAQVSSIFKMIFKCFVILQAIV